MGRKIPLPKRHFGVTDPVKQREEREKKIASTINNPPKDINAQETSNKFKKFIMLKEAAKTGKLKNRPATVDDDFNSTKIDLDGLKRNVNESEYKFLRRVNRVTNQRRLEAQFAAKYKVDIIRNQETGEIKLKKKPKDEIEELMKVKRNEARSGKKSRKIETPSSNDSPKLTSLQKMKLKKKTKMQNEQEEKSKVFAEYQRDEFKFGEYVQGPPTLVTPRKAEKSETVPRPGKRDLLLTSMLKSDVVANSTTTKKLIVGKPQIIIRGPVDKKGKRKKLPNSTRIALEAERVNAVDMYRQMKKKQPIVKVAYKNV